MSAGPDIARLDGAHLIDVPTPDGGPLPHQLIATLDAADGHRACEMTPWFGDDLSYVPGRGWVVSSGDLDAPANEGDDSGLNEQARQFAEALVGNLKGDPLVSGRALRDDSREARGAQFHVGSSHDGAHVGKVPAIRQGELDRQVRRDLGEVIADDHFGDEPSFKARAIRLWHQVLRWLRVRS